MKTVEIMFDFLAGPLWPKYSGKEIGSESTGIDIIDNDEEVKEISQKISDMYDSYYIITEKEVSFNSEQERKDKERMLSLLEKLNKRLEEINDGSFTVIDKETERVRKLKPLKIE